MTNVEILRSKTWNSVLFLFFYPQTHTSDVLSVPRILSTHTPLLTCPQWSEFLQTSALLLINSSYQKSAVGITSRTNRSPAPQLSSALFKRVVGYFVGLWLKLERPLWEHARSRGQFDPTRSLFVWAVDLRTVNRGYFPFVNFLITSGHKSITTTPVWMLLICVAFFLIIAILEIIHKVALTHK